MKHELIHYVYALFAPDDRAFAFPRYIGKGQGVRAFGHPGSRTKGVQRWMKGELGGEEPLFDIIHANLSEGWAFVREIKAIAQYGREGIDEGGVLLNRSIGGARVKPEDHRRAWFIFLKERRRLHKGPTAIRPCPHLPR